MFPQRKDLIGYWTGLIVHPHGSAVVQVHIDSIQDDGALHGKYLFPKDASEMGGEFTAELYGPWLFVKLSPGDSHGKLHFHLHILGEERPEMMYGAIPRAHHMVPHATITVFREYVLPGSDQETILGAWQVFFLEGL